MNTRIPSPILVACAATLIVVAMAAPAHLRDTLPCGEPSWNRKACPPPAAAPEPKRPKICDPAWSCGHLAKGEAGMKEGVWYLKYEDKHGPAMLEIVFREGAQCSVNGVSQECATALPSAGSESVFSGTKKGEVFEVSEMGFTTPK